MSVAGAADGAYALSACLPGRRAKGAQAAAELGFAAAAPPTLPRAEDAPFSIKPFWHVERSKGAAFVDFQHDVAAKDVALAAKEGFVSVEH